jgi:hypothetical protein
MKLFKDTYRDARNKTVRQYEAEQPLLVFCSGHWKTEHMLSSILTGLNSSGNRSKNKAISRSTGKFEGSQIESTS